MPPKRAAAAGGAPQPPGAGGEAFPPPVPAFSALTLSGSTVLQLLNATTAGHPQLCLSWQ
jgi:hypothetical protein